MTMRGDRCPLWVKSGDLETAAAHFRACFPSEGVGFLTETGFVPLENISARPTMEFEVDPEEWLRHGKVLAVLHSHVNGVQAPGAADMRSQAASGVPWAIICTDGQNCGEPIWFGDQLAIPHLYERSFKHGVMDCYSLIRDAYRLGSRALAAIDPPDQRIFGWPHNPVTLPDFPRNDFWWVKEDGTPGEDMYLANFAKAGFEEVYVDRQRPDPKVGDVFLMKLANPNRVNHGGIYAGNGLILHHVTGYTSHRAPLNLWAIKAHCWLRYTGPGSAFAK